MSEPCEFGPPHEPFGCLVHLGGIRMRLDAERCDRAEPALDPPGSAASSKAAASPDEALDVERLYRAVLDELVVLWGEPSDGISRRVRPIVARNIAERYAALDREAGR